MVAVAALLACLVTAHANAQAWPTRPIKLVVPYPPGASTDIVARSVAQKIAEPLGQPVLIDNRGGASGSIGSDYVAKSVADGYTFQIGTDATHASNVHLTRNFPYDPVRDFTAITAAVANIIVLVVHSGVPANSVAALIEHAKRNPGRLGYGSSGTGSPHHLSGELLRQLVGIDIVHVPYKGGGPAVSDLLGGQIPMVFASMATVAQHISSGKLRALGVIEPNRYAALPQIPTIGETVRGFELSSWLGFFAPAGLPAPILARLSTEIVKALKSDDLRSKFEPAGLAVIGNSPAEFAAMVKAATEGRGRLIKAAGIQPD